MTDTSYYIRVRGQIRGPFSLDELRSMRERGLFRRFHEISTDRDTWSPAGCLGALFGCETEPRGRSFLPESSAGAAAPSAGAAARRWHYVSRRGVVEGPVSPDQLAELWVQHRLPADTLVWKEGMAAWLPLNSPQTGLVLPPRAGRWRPAWRAGAAVAVAVRAFLGRPGRAR
jgi:hypothetical protein